MRSPSAACPQSAPHSHSPRRDHLRLLVPWLCISCCATFIGLLLAWAFGARFDGLLYDIGITSRPPRKSHDVVIVGIDEAFMGSQRTAIMPRDRLARLITTLASYQPSVIVVDVWLDSFFDNDERNSRPHGMDAQLRRSLLDARRAGVPVLLAQVSTRSIAGIEEKSIFARKSGSQGTATGITAHSTTIPYFAKVAHGVGNVDAEPDADGIFRTIPFSGLGSPSLPLQAAMLHAERHQKPLPPALVSRLQNEQTPIDFLGGPNAIYIQSAHELMAQPYKAIVMGGHAVFVGATYERSADLARTPYSIQSADASRFLYGVELLAQSTATMLAGAPLHSADSLLARLHLGVAAFLLCLIVTRLALRGAPWGVGACAGVTVLGYAVAIASTYSATSWLGRHFWPASPLLFSALLACVGGIGYQQMQNARELRDLTSIFQGHVGKQVLDQIKLKRPELGGEMRDIALLFCDIRGFSTLGEQLRDDPVRLLALLNEHFEPLVHALERREAYTDNYVGDLVMGVFGAPFSRSLSDDTRHAVLAGIDFVRIMRERAQKQAALGEAVIEAGVGIHCGPAVVGYLGTREHMHYTAVGDTVNIASRIESSTRKYNEPLLVTEEVVQACGDSGELPAKGWEFVAETKLKGRDTPVRLYRRNDLDALVAASHEGFI